MNKGVFFKLHLKRAFKIYPEILLITVLTVSAIVVAAAGLISDTQNGETKQKISVAIVGDIKDTHFGIGINLLENFDSSRFFVEFPRMTEKEAITALKKGEIKGYVYIPKEFVRGVYYGDNIPAKYVISDAPEGFGTAISGEVLKVVSNLVVETQNGSYSLRDVAKKIKQTKGIGKKVNDMNFSYIEFVLSRDIAIETQFVGVADSISLSGYYVCGIITFFLLIWGISCNKLLSERNLALSRSLQSSGLKISLQMLAEYISFLCITFLTLLLFASLIGVVTTDNSFGVKEFNNNSVFSCVAFVFLMLPVIIMFTAMHKALYELFPNSVSSIIVQFLIAVGLGYISGCFYPIYFFPDAVQKISIFLPSGAGFSYLRKLMSHTVGWEDFIIISSYTLLFAIAAYYKRKKDMRGESI